MLADRAERALPAYAGAIRSITRSYVRLRYEAGASETELLKMQRLLRGFRP